MGNRIIISVRDNIEDDIALKCVLSVIKQGKISKVKNKNQYCFYTRFENNISVSARSKYNISSDSFIVFREQNTGIKKWDSKIGEIEK